VLWVARWGTAQRRSFCRNRYLLNSYRTGRWVYIWSFLQSCREHITPTCSPLPYVSHSFLKERPSHWLCLGRTVTTGARRRGRGRPFHLAGERNPNFRLKTIPSLILAGAKVILPSGWEKEDTMDAVTYCEGEETRCCEGGVCFLAPEDKAEPEDPQPFGSDYEDFGEL